MNNFVKVLALVLVLVAMVSLVACGPANNESSQSTQESSKPSASSSSSVNEEENKDPKEMYVKVVDEDGNPIADVTVQLCKSSGMCLLPTKTDAEGKATIYTEREDGCYVTVKNADGFAFDENEKFYYEAGEFELTITLKKA